MRCTLRFSPAALLLCLALCSHAAFGQSLSLIKKTETNYWVQASASPANPQTLQASENMHLWVDIHAEVAGEYSFEFDRPDVSQRYFRLSPTASPLPPIRVLLIGDSMTADCCGWGRGIYGYFKPDAIVVNYAQAWTSTKVFLASAEWDKMLEIKPDYVLIQYGFVDGAWGAELAPDRYSSLAEFEENLHTIVQTVRGFNGVPILVTLHSARLWDSDGRVILAWQDRNAVTKKVAADLKTPLIDLNQLTMDMLNQLGPSGSAFMQWDGGDSQDLMHLSQLGGEYVSRLVVKSLPDNLGPYLIGILDPPPKP